MADFSNFYKDFTFGSDKFDNLKDSHNDIFEMFYNMAQQHFDNAIFTNSETYRYIPMQMTKVGNAVYNLSELLSDSYTASLLGPGMSTLSIPELLKKWNNDITIQQKIRLLEYQKKYILLVTDREGNLDDKVYDVVDFELYNDFDVKLIRNIDYAYSDNKIYLLGDLAKYPSTRSIVLKNIYVDYNHPESFMGKSVLTPYKSFLTKNEYRELVEVFIKTSLGGPILGNLNSALSSLSGMDGFKIIDKISARDFYRDFWEEGPNNQHPALTRFDFIVMSPLEIMLNRKKIDLVKEFLGLVKPAYTNFMMTPYTDFVDLLRANTLRNIFDNKVSTSLFDSQYTRESNKYKMHLHIDKETFYDNIMYDGISGTRNDIVRYDFDGLYYDQLPSVVDVILRADFPRVIPFFGIKDKVIGKENPKMNPKMNIKDKLNNLRDSAGMSAAFDFNEIGKNLGTSFSYDLGHAYDDDIVCDTVIRSGEYFEYSDEISFKLIRKGV